jgi:hypothetical protein
MTATELFFHKYGYPLGASQRQSLRYALAVHRVRLAYVARSSLGCIQLAIPSG